VSYIPGGTYEFVAQGFASGLVGTLGFRLDDGGGTPIIVRTTAGIAEAAPGVYTISVTFPAMDPGTYVVIWDDGSGGSATEQVVVSAAPTVLYTTVESIQGRAGRLLDDLRANPTRLELEGFIAEVGDTLNGYLSGAGLDAPATDPITLGALRGTATDGALILALEARFQGRGTEDSVPILDGARQRWNVALKALGDGTHPALISAQETALGGGGSFFADEAQEYVPYPLRTEAGPANPNTTPELYEGMHL
jgi:hypothetical protein